MQMANLFSNEFYETILLFLNNIKEKGIAVERGEDTQFVLNFPSNTIM